MTKQNETFWIQGIPQILKLITTRKIRNDFILKRGSFHWIVTQSCLIEVCSNYKSHVQFFFLSSSISSLKDGTVCSQKTSKLTPQIWENWKPSEQKNWLLNGISPNLLWVNIRAKLLLLLLQSSVNYINFHLNLMYYK